MRPQSNGAIGGLQHVISDILDLCELQWQLFSVDGQEAKRHCVKAGICLAIGLEVALAAFLAAVLGVGWLLHEQYALPVGTSILIASGVALLLAVATLLVAARLLAKASEALKETRRELGENVRWIKSVVLQPGSSSSNQRPQTGAAPEIVSADASR